MKSLMTIGIFKSENETFFGCDDATMLDALRHAASAVSGMPVKKNDPDQGTRATMVGEVVVQPVEESDGFEVKIRDVAKPDTARKPDGQSGSWAIQSLVFSKEKFTRAEAEAWVKAHKPFVNLGVDETDTSYRFRQYDPGYFAQYRTFDLDDGITAIYGMIKSDEKRDDEEAEKDIAASVAAHAAIKALNETILKRSVKLMPGSVEKADDQEEERFVLGLVLEPTDGADGAPLKPDTQGDIYSAADIRKSAHGWMERYGAIDLMHNWEALGAGKVAILESYIAPCDFTIGKGEDAYDVVKGSWLLALRIKDDGIWKAIKAGEIGAFSVGGKAVREELEP